MHECKHTYVICHKPKYTFSSLGIVTAYRHHHKTRRAVASLWGLAFLPEHQIPEALEYVQSQFTGLEPLMGYFIDTWMNGPYDMGWVVYRQPIRTNNSLEGRV